jgi:hypothetical protein
MSDINDGGPAFPVPTYGLHAPQDGMTLREYAAIKLKVPNSGTDWLDEMIRKSLRDEFAAKALQGMIAAAENYQTHELAQYAYDIADAMLEARKEQK